MAKRVRNSKYCRIMRNGCRRQPSGLSRGLQEGKEFREHTLGKVRFFAEVLMKLEKMAPELWNTPSGGATAALASERWESLLSESYTEIVLNERLAPNFQGHIRRLALGELTLVECCCDPHGGKHSPRSITGKSEATLAIQVIVAGSELMRSSKESSLVVGGDVIVWANQYKIEYEVAKDLHKITLIVPAAELRGRVADDWFERGSLLDRADPAATLLAAHIRALAECYDDLPARAASLKRATLELVIAALDVDKSATTLDTDAPHHLMRVKNFVLDRLSDDELRLSDVAAANGISLRYLHMLFETSGITIGRWILEQRLDRCRDALLDQRRSASRSITEVAFAWGFKDLPHFTKSFKRQYGITPSRCRSEYFNVDDNVAVRNRV